jgi:hypothetical protein
VRAIKPSLAVVTSGASAAPVAGAGVLAVLEAVLLEVAQPCKMAVPTAVAPAVRINLRLERLLMVLKNRE